LFSKKETRIMPAPDLSSAEIPSDETLVRGWTPERQTRFLDHLSTNGNVRSACRRIGLSREAAYRLRRRDPLFARGWAAAVVKAHDHSIEVLADRAIEGVEEAIYHRGELIGTRRRYDSRLLLAHIARLDKVVEDEAAQADAARFDELLARIAGEKLPDGMESDDGILPIERQRFADKCADQVFDLREEKAADDGEPDEIYLDDDDPAMDEAAREARDAELLETYGRTRAEGERHWDGWFDNACAFVDFTTGWLDEPPVTGLPGGPPQPPRPSETTGEIFSPRTLTTVSTYALARSLAGGEKGFVPPHGRGR
jgi:hypothetical protein